MIVGVSVGRGGAGVGDWVEGVAGLVLPLRFGAGVVHGCGWSFLFLLAPMFAAVAAAISVGMLRIL